jgi:hypothetical protein
VLAEVVDGVGVACVDAGSVELEVHDDLRAERFGECAGGGDGRALLLLGGKARVLEIFRPDTDDDVPAVELLQAGALLEDVVREFDGVRVSTCWR